MQQIPQPRGSNPHQDLLPGEEQDIRAEIASVIANGREWLNQPNELLGGRAPKDLIGTPDEHRLRDLTRAAKHSLR